MKLYERNLKVFTKYWNETKDRKTVVLLNCVALCYYFEHYLVLSVDFCKGINNMRTEVWVYILGEKFSPWNSVLGPVCVVTDINILAGNETKTQRECDKR